MEAINKNIRQLLEMLDNPEPYTEQEIQDIINRDEDTRNTYRMMVEAKRSSRQRQAGKPVDVDAAWRKFNKKIQHQKHRLGWKNVADSLSFGRSRSRSEEQMRASLSSRIVASFIGALLISGITFAAIHIVYYTQQNKPKTEQPIDTPKPASFIPTDTLTTDAADVIDTIATPQPVIYDNMPLEEMLPEIAAHYDAKVTFVNEEARQLRFYFVWNPQKGINQVVSDLNQFERLNISIEDNQITVK